MLQLGVTKPLGATPAGCACAVAPNPEPATPAAPIQTRAERMGGGAAAAATAGASNIGMLDRPAAAAPAPLTAPTQVQLGKFKDSSWVQAPGRASDSPQARAIYENVAGLVAKFPTAAALTAAGFKPNAGSNGTHWRIPGEKTYSDGKVFVGNLVTNREGATTGAQMDTHMRAGTQPPAWPGVQWHFHDDNTAGWMHHVDVRKPIDEAFVQHDHLASGGAHAAH